jgi:AcrR family transcriptional regulator
MSSKGDLSLKNKTATRIPVQTRAQEKRQRILGAAFTLFSEQGYEAVGMRDIAAAAGVSTGTVYAYFADKKMTFIEVFALYSEELKSGIFNHIYEGLTDHRDIEEFAYGLIHRLFDIFSNRLKLHRDVILLSLVDDQARSVYTALERQGEAAVVGAFFDRFRDRIDAADAQAAQFVVHKAIDEIIQYLLFYEVPIDRDRVFRETARMIARYLEKR